MGWKYFKAGNEWEGAMGDKSHTKGKWQEELAGHRNCIIRKQICPSLKLSFYTVNLLGLLSSTYIGMAELWFRQYTLWIVCFGGGYLEKLHFWQKGSQNPSANMATRTSPNCSPKTNINCSKLRRVVRPIQQYFFFSTIPREIPDTHNFSKVSLAEVLYLWFEMCLFNTGYIPF